MFLDVTLEPNLETGICLSKESEKTLLPDISQLKSVLLYIQTALSILQNYVIYCPFIFFSPLHKALVSKATKLTGIFHLLMGKSMMQIQISPLYKQEEHSTMNEAHIFLGRCFQNK